MRILAGGRLPFVGQDQCPEFDDPQEALPRKLEVLLCLSDDAERRQTKRVRADGKLEVHMKRALLAIWLIGAIRLQHR